MSISSMMDNVACELHIQAVRQDALTQERDDARKEVERLRAEVAVLRAAAMGAAADISRFTGRIEIDYGTRKTLAAIVERLETALKVE